MIRAVSLERGILHNISIAVDEWGLKRLHAGNSDIPHRPGKWIVNLENALVTALDLNAFIRHAYSVRIANFVPMPTSVRMNLTRPDSPVMLHTIFYPFELYSRTCGQLALDVFWDGDTFSGTYKNRSYTGIRTLDVAATLDKSRKQLVIYVVNQSQKEALETTISLTSGQFTGSVQVSVVNGPDINAENTEEKPNQVGVIESIVKASGKSFVYTFEPHSITALVCAVS